MSVLQELNPAQMSESLVGACDKQIPMTVVTIHRDDAWLNLRSRFLTIDRTRLIFEAPTVEKTASSLDDILPAEKVGVSFKYKHHKHLFSTTVLNFLEEYPGPEGRVKAMVLGCPTTMQRIQRRAFYRVMVPPNRIVRAAFWLGGCKAEPSGTSLSNPVWSGNVEDISAGGFQIKTCTDAGMGLDSGDIVGLRMTFGVGAEAVFANAQFRHCKPADDGALLGFQFVGLGQDDESKDALRMIVGKVSEYQRLGLRPRKRSTASEPS